MKKFRQLTVSGILISILALGLAGCGNNSNHNTSSSSSKDKASKIVKKTTTKKKYSATKDNDSTSSNSAVTDNNESSNSSSNSNTSTSSSNNIQRQLGLGDTATWTDNNGITHHVDSDGMDRQTTAGSSQVNYADWSGPLPNNAQINRKN